MSQIEINQDELLNKELLQQFLGGVKYNQPNSTKMTNFKQVWYKVNETKVLQEFEFKFFQVTF